MSEADADIATLVAGLADTNPRRREEAAAEIFRRGCAAIEPVLKKWFADREFRDLVRAGRPLLRVGVAVIPARFEEIRRQFGEPRLAVVPPDQDAREFELNVGRGVRLDVLTTVDPTGAGAISRFLQRFGEGLQQVECEIRDVERGTKVLRERFGLEPIYPETRPGADGTRVNFFLVPVAEQRKVLVELVEVPEKSKAI